MRESSAGEILQRKNRRRRIFAISMLGLLVIGVALVSLINTNMAQSENPINIAAGTGAQLQTSFIGPKELVVHWGDITGEAWSVSLIEGRILNASAKKIKFHGISYYIKDQNGNLLWVEKDSRFPNGGKIDPLGSIFFAYTPVSMTDARTFELLIRGAEVLSR